MKLNFDRCLTLLLQSEGGFVSNPRDPGGATNLGVTLETARENGLDEDRDADVDVADVKLLTPAAVAPVYRAKYWSAVHGDELPSGLDYMLLDAAVNHGPTRARRYLQLALGLQPDGILGPQTMAALAKADVRAVINAVSAYRHNLYVASHNFAEFGRGWLSRLEKVTKQSLEWAQ